MNRLLLCGAFVLAQGIALAQSYSVTGEVVKPGTFPLAEGATVLKALSAAGGLTPHASLKKCIVIRGAEKIPVNVRNILNGKDQDIPLLDGDTLRIPKAEPRPIPVAPASLRESPRA